LEAEEVVAGRQVEAPKIKAKIIQLEEKEELLTCNENSEGSLYYNKNEKSFFGCNGKEWVRLNKSSSINDNKQP